MSQAEVHRHICWLLERWSHFKFKYENPLIFSIEKQTHTIWTKVLGHLQHLLRHGNLYYEAPGTQSLR